MCGRFTLRSPAAAVAEQFALPEVPPLAPRFNIAPSQPVAVVRLAPGKSPPRCELVLLRWGLIPAWAKDPAIGSRMINARAETAAEKPAYRSAFQRRRCLLPADGFYEWQGGGRRKQPYFIHLRDDRLFAFAGLWESWQGAEGSRIESCTLLTTGANELVRPIHDRMPVILAPQAYGPWLDPSAQADTLAPLMAPYPADEMASYPIGGHVNNPANDDPQCVEPQRDLFS